MAGGKGQPKWRNVADDITSRINADEWPIGEKIPSITRLMAHYGVSRNVALQAITELQRAGVLEGHGGSGNYVAAKPGETPQTNTQLTQRLAELEARVRRLEQQAGTQSEGEQR